MKKTICQSCFREIKKDNQTCNYCDGVGVENIESLQSDSKELVKSPSILLIIGVIVIPFIFSWVTLKRGYSKKFRFFSFLWMMIVFLSLIDDTEKEIDLKTSKETTSSKTLEIENTSKETISNKTLEIEKTSTENPSIKTLEYDKYIDLNVDIDGYEYDAEDVIDMQLSSTSLHNSIRWSLYHEIRGVVNDLIITDFRVEGREKRELLKEVLNNNNYKLLPSFSHPFYDEYLPEKLDFYCKNSKDEYTKLLFSSDYSKCYKKYDTNSYLFYTHIYLVEPLHIRDVVCVIDGFIKEGYTNKEIPVCRSQSISGSKRKVIRNKFYKLYNVNPESLDLFVGDLLKIDIALSGLSDSTTDYSVSSIEILENEQLIFEKGRSRDKKFSDACFKRYTATESYYDEEVLDENFLVDSEVLCGVWKKF